MGDNVGVKIPNFLAEKARDKLVLSGFASLNELVKSNLRKWLEDIESGKSSGIVATRGNVDELSKRTTKALFPLWVRNFRRNIDDAEKGRDLIQLADKYAKKKSAIIIGAGPSVHSYNHLKMLRDSNYSGLIVATDRILIPCLKAGVVPDVVISLDGDFEVSQFFKDELVQKHCGAMSVLFSTVVDNTTVQMWPRKDNVYFFNPLLDTMYEDMSVSMAMHLISNRTVMQTGGNVGSACWFFSVFMKKSPICLIGMDLSYHDTPNVEDLPGFQTYVEMEGGVMEKVLPHYSRDYNPIFKNTAILDDVFRYYREIFKSWSEAIFDAHGVRTINCTGGGSIHSMRSVECMYFDEFLKKHGK